MRYLVTMGDFHTPFLTAWFEYENHWQDNADMVVYDLLNWTYTTDGKNWHSIETDQL